MTRQGLKIGYKNDIMNLEVLLHLCGFVSTSFFCSGREGIVQRDGTFSPLTEQEES